METNGTFTDAIARVIQNTEGTIIADGKSSHFKYGYASIDAVLAHLRKAMSDEGITLGMNELDFSLHQMSESGKKPPMILAKYEFWLEWKGKISERESLTQTAILGKDQTPGAIRSYALKYWLRAKFMLSIGEGDLDSNPTGGIGQSPPPSAPTYGAPPPAPTYGAPPPAPTYGAPQPPPPDPAITPVEKHQQDVHQQDQIFDYRQQLFQLMTGRGFQIQHIDEVACWINGIDVKSSIIDKMDLKQLNMVKRFFDITAALQSRQRLLEGVQNAMADGISAKQLLINFGLLNQ